MMRLASSTFSDGVRTHRPDAQADHGDSEIVTLDPVAPIQPTVERFTAPRSGSKIAAVLDLLARNEGASIDEIIGATGWLPHTTRAALTGLRKRGCAIERHRDASLTSYRVANGSVHVAAKSPEHREPDIHRAGDRGDAIALERKNPPAERKAAKVKPIIST